MRVVHALLLLTLVVPAAGVSAQTVATRSGRVAAAPGRDASILAFRGIPYAAPPVGELRWAAPASPASWGGVRPSAFGAACPQNIVQERKPWTYEFMAHDEVSEDCLFLNVWTGGVRGANRPVFVYLHGGGFNEGSGSVPVYDGEGLARKGLVVVTVNYRLGALGFLAHPELTAASGRRASGNYGLLDQIAALRWVRENVRAFGGDPSRVTIAGQSAGGMSVLALIASPLAKGLFHRAIVESSLNPLGNRTLADAEADGVRLAAAKGAASLAALRALPAAALIDRGGIAFRPVVDGYVLPASPDEIVARDEHHDVPVLIGANADEGGATPQGAADENERARERTRTSIYQWALDRARTSKTKTFTYFWTHTLPGPDAARYGAFHTSEVPYALNTLSRSDRPFTDADHRIADLMSSYWANFAAAGDPNGRGLPLWPAVTASTKVTMEIGDRTAAVPLAGAPLTTRAASPAAIQTGFLNRTVSVAGVEHRYQVYVPHDYDRAAARPVILALHGAGERGDDGLLQTDVGLARAIRRHPERFPALVVFPQAPRGDGPGWHEAGSRIALAALDRTMAEFNGDPARVYLTGLSMGGNGSWYLAYHHPERFAAVVVVCGWASERRSSTGGFGYPAIAADATGDPLAAVAARVARLPIRIFHGDKDPLVPVDESRAMAAALQRAGANVEYVEFPGVGHNAWDPTYERADLFEWLLAQRKVSEAPPSDEHTAPPR